VIILREYWDVYGEDYRKIDGKIAIRGKHDLGLHEYHLVVYAWIVSSDGRVIISRRQKGRSFGGTWECTGGCAKAGEDSKTAVLREVKEELGITLKEENGRLYKRYKRRYPVGAKAICDVWVFHQDISPNEFHLQTDEVSDVKTVTFEELLDMQLRGAFKKRYFYLEDMLATLKAVTVI